MKNRLREHIETVFADAPNTEKARELKEEIYRNLCDRYDDLISEGKSEGAAFGLAVSGLGDMSEVIDSLREDRGGFGDGEKGGNAGNYREKAAPKYTPEQIEAVEKYRVKAGIMNSVAIALYILCWVPLVILTELFANISGADIIGMVIMMVMIAVATALMVLKGSIKPYFMKGDSDDDDDDDGDDEERNEAQEKPKRKNTALKIISGAIWGATVPFYLAISFITGAWHITWVVFLISVAVDNIVEALFELFGKKYVD